MIAWWVWVLVAVAGFALAGAGWTLSQVIQIAALRKERHRSFTLLERSALDDR